MLSGQGHNSDQSNLLQSNTVNIQSLIQQITVRTLTSTRTTTLPSKWISVANHLVRKRYSLIPKAVMSVPGLQDVVVTAVLDIVQKECKFLTSQRFGSVLQQTTPSDLKDFKWDNVLLEWSTVAPTFLKFIKAAAALSDQKSERKRFRRNLCTTAMAGSTLLNARSHKMSAHKYRNSLVLRFGGAKKRCIERLSRLGTCMSYTMTLKRLKDMGKSWDRKLLQWKAKLQTGQSEHQVWSCFSSKLC